MRLSGRFSWTRGLLFRVGFLPSGARVSSGRIHVCMALVDTGARRTCITTSVVDALTLPPSRENFEMQTAGGPYKTSLYDLRVAVFVDKTEEWSKPMSVESPVSIAWAVNSTQFWVGMCSGTAT